jgi:hypothetical protein
MSIYPPDPDPVPGATPAFTRVLRAAARQGEVRAVLEDDFHHFRVTLHHDGGRIDRLVTTPLRWPWTMCTAAGLEVGRLDGGPLTPDMTEVFRRADARQQCTHQFDLAAFAIVIAAKQVAARHYEIVVPEPVDGRSRATLERDGTPLLAWETVRDRIVAPPPYAGRTIGTGFTAWVADGLDPDESEAALLLRRGVFLGLGRMLAKRTPDPVKPAPRGACWVMQPERTEASERMHGCVFDFSGRAYLLTRDDDDWLAFAD